MEKNLRQESSEVKRVVICGPVIPFIKIIVYKVYEYQAWNYKDE